jgi:hypothetical protein
MSSKEEGTEPDVVVQACNPSTQKDEAGGLQVPGQPGYMARFYLKKQRPKPTTKQTKIYKVHTLCLADVFSSPHQHFTMTIFKQQRI